jgi:hypothetical protein
VVTHPDLPETAAEEIWGDVHMYPFHESQRRQEVSSRVQRLLADNRALNQKLCKARNRAHALDRSLRQAEQALKAQTGKMESLQAQNDDIKRDSRAQRLVSENAAMCAQLEKAERLLQVRNKAIERLKAEMGQQANELSVQREVNQALQGEIERTLRERRLEEAHCEDCPSYDLCARRVLLVGGIEKLSAFYRDVVEKMGGCFEYHDGSISTGNGGQTLAGLIRRADVVLCPVDVNSHNACLSVKKYCKKWEKPYHMLASSSISNISRTLTRVAVEACD